MTCFSFGSGFWLSKIWEASLPSYPPYLQLHKKKPLGVGWKRKAHKRPLWGMKHLERSESIKWGAKEGLFWKLTKKSQATWHKELRWLDSRPFYSSTTRDGMIDTSKFTSARWGWNISYARFIPLEVMFHLSPFSFTRGRAKAKCGGVVNGP